VGYGGNGDEEAREGVRVLFPLIKKTQFQLVSDLDLEEG